MGSRSAVAFDSRISMKAASSFEKIFIHRDPVDMRRGISGLCDLVQATSMGDLSGKNLFLFCGKRRNSLKILYFDRSGFCLWQKRLETELFPWPKKSTKEIVDITPEQLMWLLEGIDVWKMKKFSEIKFERVS
jgi:transposase